MNPTKIEDERCLNESWYVKNWHCHEKRLLHQLDYDKDNPEGEVTKDDSCQEEEDIEDVEEMEADHKDVVNVSGDQSSAGGFWKYELCHNSCKIETISDQLESQSQIFKALSFWARAWRAPSLNLDLTWPNFGSGLILNSTLTWTLSLTQTKYHVIEERMAEQVEQEQSLFYKKFDKESGIFRCDSIFRIAHVCHKGILR